MKIFIPFKIQETGGASSFANKFKSGMEKRGHEVFFDFREDYDILFVIVRCPFRYLLHAKRKKRKIIHRLDGVYYWSVAKWRYPLLNLAPKIIHKFFSDFTVYQSNYSKHCSERFLGKRKNEKFSIIYNGVDIELFSPEGEKNEDIKDNPEQKIFINVSKFRRKDQIMPIINALEIYKNKYNDNFKMIIVGDFSREVSNFPLKFRSIPHLKFLGKIKNNNLPKYERAADIFIFTHLNPPCPNNIIEAMACGLPICGISDGAMKEIITEGNNGLLAQSENNAFWKKRECDSEEIAKNITKLLERKNFFSQNSRKLAEEKFSLDKMINNYLRIIQELI